MPCCSFLTWLHFLALIEFCKNSNSPNLATYVGRPWFSEHSYQISAQNNVCILLKWALKVFTHWSNNEVTCLSPQYCCIVVLVSSMFALERTYPQCKLFLWCVPSFTWLRLTSLWLQFLQLEPTMILKIGSMSQQQSIHWVYSMTRRLQSDHHIGLIVTSFCFQWPHLGYRVHNELPMRPHESTII
jgi:hypothetical protein